VNTPPPPAAGTPQDANHKKNATMMYAVVTIVIIIIVGAGLMFMSVSSRSSEQPVANTTAVPPATAIPTEQPTMTPVPATPEEEAEAVNVTVDDTDIQQAEKDLQGL
jgi:flagellar basal body-associated protein FliL